MKTNLFVALLLLLCSFSCAMAKKLPPDVRICNVWIEPNVNQNDGLVAHLDFDVENWDKSLIYIRLYIYDNEKNKWLGTYKNECCLEKYSDICRIIYDEVKYRNGTSYRDVKLYIPLKYMQLKKGTNRYYASVEIGRLAETQARSKLIPFTASGTGGSEGTNQDLRLQMFGGSLSHAYKGELNDCTPTVVQSNTQPINISVNSNSGNRSVSSNSSYKSNQSSLSAITGAILVIGALAAAITSVSESSKSSSSSSHSSYSSSSSSSSSSRPTSVCSYCTGRGMMNCVWCYGRGIRSGGLFSSDETCSWCKGRGQTWCYHCNGKGSR